MGYLPLYILYNTTWYGTGTGTVLVTVDTIGTGTGTLISVFEENMFDKKN
jgi:hypothetical protein